MNLYIYPLFLCFSAIAMFVSPALGVVRNVPADYPTIQAAIAAAADTDEIVVAPGRYYENLNFLGKAITVRSSQPNMIDPNQPLNWNDPSATILDGSQCSDPNNSVVTFNHGETQTSVLEGFIITGGTGTWIPVAWSLHQVYWNRCGGGVVCYNLSAPTIRRNIFADNLAGQGGGVYVYGDPVNPVNPQNPPVHLIPVISYNRFENNRAIVLHGFSPPNEQYPWNDHGDGGAYVGFQAVDAVLENNHMINNFADNYGGAIHVRQWCEGVIRNNTIQNNQSTLGAGLHITYQSAPLIERNVIDGNSATNLGGGGLYIYFESYPTVRGNTIKNNSSTRGAGIGIYWTSHPLIENNMILQNQTGEGILCSSSAAVIRYNTIAGNTAPSTSGAIRCESSSSTQIENNIISRNGAGYGLFLTPDSSPNSIQVRYNLIYDHPLGPFSPALPAPPEENGNIYADPSFLNEAIGDYHIALNSPCVSAADPDYTPPSGIVDYDGDLRKIGERSDIGADEILPVKNTTTGTLYTTIQSAIQQAANGNIIEVARGHYTESISFGTKQLVVRSTNPQDWNTVYATVIDANRTGTAVVICGSQTSQSRFEGFTVTGGLATNGHGGGILCFASPVIANNYIHNNEASYKGGGVYFWNSDCAAVLRDNRIVANIASYGAGVFCDTNSKITMKHNWIAQNYAVNAAGGLCISFAHSDTHVMHTIFLENSSQSGAAVYLTGSSIGFWNNQILGNSASLKAGAICIENGNPSILQNTILDNRAAFAGGIYCSSAISPLLAGNIIAFCSQGEGIYDEFDDPENPLTAYLSHNNVYDNAGGNYGGELTDLTGQDGNISADPKIAFRGIWDDNGTPDLLDDDAYRLANVHLLPGSPCINAGDMSMLPPALTQDIDAESRVLYNQVEIGADEIDPATNPADINEDGIVDAEDMTLLLEGWLQTGGGYQGDITGDNIVNLPDWTILVENWLWQAYWHIP